MRSRTFRCRLVADASSPRITARSFDSTSAKEGMENPTSSATRTVSKAIALHVIFTSQVSMCTGRSIQFLLRKELRNLIRDLDIVQVRHQEVCVAANSDLGKMHQASVTTMFVDGVNPKQSH